MLNIKSADHNTDEKIKEEKWSNDHKDNEEYYPNYTCLAIF